MRMRRLARRCLRQRAEAESGPGQGELSIVPLLDIVMNLILFLMATSTAVLAISDVDVTLRTHGRGPVRQALALGVVVGQDAIHVTGTGLPAQRIARLPGGDYDFDALRRAAIDLKERFPLEDDVVVTADPNVEYEHLVHAMDAVRASPDVGPLFDDVQIAAGVR